MLVRGSEKEETFVLASGSSDRAFFSSEVVVVDSGRGDEV